MGCFQARVTEVISTGPAVPMSEIAAAFAQKDISLTALRYVGVYVCSRKLRPECLRVKHFRMGVDKNDVEWMGLDEAYTLLSAIR